MSTQDFHSFLRSLGLQPKAIVADGKWHRCPTDDRPRSRNGSYKLAVDGQIGFAQNWAIHQEPVVWRPEGIVAAPRVDRQEVSRRRAEEREWQDAAVRGAREFYEKSQPLLGGHPYLESHGLDMAGCFGLRVDAKGWLVIPAFRQRRISTVQRIAPDGTKRFWRGAPVKGASYTIDRRSATLTVLCEGFATGLAIFAAVQTCRVVVAFNAGNMAEVISEVPPGLTVVAADNDHGTEGRIGTNPGIVAAEYAAGLLGCGVAVPEGMEGTDWSDLRQERLAERLATRRPHEREGEVRRDVDAEIAMELMRHARFRTALKEAS